MKRYIKADIVDPRDEGDADIRCEIAKTTRSLDVMQQFFNDKSYRVRRSLIENPNLPEDMYRELLDNEFLVDLTIRDATTSSETLRKIFNEYFNWCKSHGVAGIKFIESFAINPNTPDDILAQLARHPSIIIRKYVAMNPNLPEDVMLKYVNDKDADIRSSVAFNPAISAENLRKLADDANPEVRSAVASNKDTPIDVLEKLLEDSDHGTSFCARCTLSDLGEL